MILVTAITQLNRRAFDRAVGAENATISIFRPEDGRAALAVVVVLASICRHAFRFRMLTKRAGNVGILDQVCHRFSVHTLSPHWARSMLNPVVTTESRAYENR
jgi:hypothetical protein